MAPDRALLQRQKARALGLPPPESTSSSGSSSRPKLSFRLYFPQPPYRGAKYAAALSKADKLFNFVGLVLGHHGKTIQRIQKASGARVEVHDSGGNLNGEHPAHDDPSLHALVLADSRAKLDKAVALLLEVLAPTNTEYRPIKVVPGGSAHLRPVIPPDWAEAAEAAAEYEAAEAAEAAAAAAEAAKQATLPPPDPVPNAWAQRRTPLTKSRSSGSGSGSGQPHSPRAEQQQQAVPPAVAAQDAAAATPRAPPPPPPPPSPLRAAPATPEAVVSFRSSLEESAAGSPWPSRSRGGSHEYARSDSHGSSDSVQSSYLSEEARQDYSLWGPGSGGGGAARGQGTSSGSAPGPGSFYEQLQLAASASFPGLSPPRFSASAPPSVGVLSPAGSDLASGAYAHMQSPGGHSMHSGGLYQHAVFAGGSSGGGEPGHAAPQAPLVYRRSLSGDDAHTPPQHSPLSYHRSLSGGDSSQGGGVLRHLSAAAPVDMGPAASMELAAAYQRHLSAAGGELAVAAASLQALAAGCGTSEAAALALHRVLSAGGGSSELSGGLSGALGSSSVPTLNSSSSGLSGLSGLSSFSSGPTGMASLPSGASALGAGLHHAASSPAAVPAPALLGSPEAAAAAAAAAQQAAYYATPPRGTSLQPSQLSPASAPEAPFPGVGCLTSALSAAHRAYGTPSPSGPRMPSLPSPAGGDLAPVQLEQLLCSALAEQCTLLPPRTPQQQQ